MSTAIDPGYPPTVRQSDFVVNEVCEPLSTLSLCGDKEQENSQKPEKDPRKIARKYQVDVCKKALEENIIVYLGTGSGKTLIAVLLMYEMGHLIKKPQKDICIFLAPSVALVQQQAKVIEESVDFKVGIYCGNSTRIRSHQEWEKEIEEYEVLVMTPKLLVHYLSHCFIKMELIALLIFDECHYAQLESDHPYAEIMKIFYKVDLVKCPRIFGMTASPKLGKGGSIDGLEALLRAKVYTVKDKDELEQFITSPKVNVYYYGSIEKGYSSPLMIYTQKLEEIKHQCKLTLGDNKLDQSSLESTWKLLQKVHSNIIFCLENLGLWGALQASSISSTGDHYEITELAEVEESCGDDNICKKYLHDAALVLASDCTKGGMEADLSCIEVLEEPIFSRKLLQLIEILSSFRSQPNMKCIIFVNRIVTARSLSNILQNLKVLSSWKCDFLVGVHSGLMSRKNTDIILEKFRSGELNLLVATKVGEEGLDIQTCCLVIRFDLPETVASFIQSRGRARMPQSEYAFLVDSGNPRELNLIEQFMEEEALMNEEISSRKSNLQITNFAERTYKVEITGATISSVTSVSLLHLYCSKLPHDEYFNPKPQFSYYDDSDGTVCNIILPVNAPVRQIVSAPQPSRKEAKRDACLKACQALHEVGALTDYLLPEHDDDYEESISDSDSKDDESRLELHQMLVPAALRVPWTEVGNFTSFNCYYIKFNPNPADRIYRRFGLFVKEPLPEEAGNLRLDLSLERGRMVMTQLIPSGVARFDKAEIASAEKFQKMFLKIILDRNEFIREYLSLEYNDVHESSSSTFYLWLPVVEHECEKVSVDWTLIKRCLSSPIFKHPKSGTGDDISQLTDHLHLASGCSSSNDTLHGLVYLPCKDTFYFISDILSEKNAYSSFDDSKSHVEHYSELYGIHLAYPDQPLLKAKPLFHLHNLLRKKKHSGEWREKKEYFIELPPEICQLKIVGFSKDIGSSLSLLPSIMHRLESFLVAIELRDKLVASFPEGAEVTTNTILEAITTEKCGEHFSLERLEVLGDAFLKFAVGRHLFLKHDALDEGQLTRKRSNITNNHNLLNLATRKNLQVYIRDQTLEPRQFFAFGRPCPVSCNEETEKSIHPQCNVKKNGANFEVRCSKSHHWLHKKTIADFVESLTGAFIVDCGFVAATAFLTWIGIQVDFSPSQTDKICSASKAFLALANQMDVNALENLLGHKFTHKGLLIQAFVHPSFNNLGGCYQRLEYLGDAVLDYLVTSYLYTAYPELKPGHLTDLRSMSVSNLSLADVAGRLSLHKFIICDSGDLHESMTKYVNEIGTSASVTEHIEERTCPKALGDLVESCMGALLIDSGFDLSHLWNIMLSLLDPVVNVSKMQFNPLRELRELCQSYNWDLQFSKLKEHGKFTVEAAVNEEEVSATASASNKSGKTAKRMAAREVFECLKAEGYRSKTIPLKEVLEASDKQEPKLVGYDEVPSKPGLLEVPQSSENDCVAKTYLLNETSCGKSIRQPPFPYKPSECLLNETIHENGFNIDSRAIHIENASDYDLGFFNVDSRCIRIDSASDDDLHGTSAPSTIYARSRLYEICAAKRWKPPVFDCWKETGPDHIKKFVYKVVMEIAKKPNEQFEFYGEPRSKKKEAAEHAAQGALWYLKHEGYTHEIKSEPNE